MDDLMREQFKEIVHDLLSDDDSGFRANMIINAADEYAESMAPKWIPCSERLPEHGGCYLVTEKISEECWFVGLAPYRSTCERWFGDHEVTAWMPLPEPYKEGEKT